MTMLYIDEIYNKVSSIEYGFHDISGQRMQKSQIKNLDYTLNHLVIQSPEQTLKNGYGNCFDQCLLICDLARKYKLLYHYILTIRDNGFHTVALLREGDGWYHLETSDSKNLGVHGPYPSPEQFISQYKKLNLKIHGEEIKGYIIDAIPKWKGETMKEYLAKWTK